MPKVSICIPAYNAEKYLLQALESVRRQSFSDWELIITEDGSKDDTENLVRNFSESVTQPVVYQRHNENKGLSAARNSCFESASGDLVALLDADDYWDFDHLESIVACFEKNDPELVHSGCIIFDEETGKDISERAPTPMQVKDWPLSIYNNTYIIQPSSAVINRRVLAQVGYFDYKFAMCNDIDFWFCMARARMRFVYTGKLTCHYRKHIDTLTARGADIVEELAWVYNKHIDWTDLPIGLRRLTTSKTFANAGRMYFRNEPARARRLYHMAWKVRPSGLHYMALAVAAALLAIMKKLRIGKTASKPK